MSPSGPYELHLNRRWSISAESRPKMLKDFLIEDMNSRSLRRLKSTTPSMDKEITRRRSRSKAASMTISALEAMAKAVRSIPRTLSKQQRSHVNKNQNKTEKIEEFADSVVAVRIKDIIRWRSFHDKGEEEEPQMLKLAPPSPIDCTTATTVSTLSTSNSSSWCESDFSSDYSPPWGRNRRDFYDHEVTPRERFALDSKSDVGSIPGFDTTDERVQMVEKFLHFSRAGEESAEVDSLEKREKKARSFSAMKIEGKRHTSWKEKESKGDSPVSVIDYEIGEDGEWRWSFKRSPAHVEINRERGEEEEREVEDDQGPFGAEEKAMELLSQVRASTSGGCISSKCSEERLLVDFFRSGLTEGRRFGIDTRSRDEDCVELVKRAESWVRGDCHTGSSYEWGIDGKKEAYLREMEKGERWNKFEEDQEEIVVEIESRVWSLLVDELLGDFFPHCSRTREPGQESFPVRLTRIHIDKASKLHSGTLPLERISAMSWAQLFDDSRLSGQLSRM